MNSRTVIKNLVVAVTLCVAGIAAWAATLSETPSVEASSVYNSHA